MASDMKLALLAGTAGLLLAACGGARTPPPTVGNSTATAAATGRSVRDVDWLDRTYGAYPVVDGSFEFALDEDGNVVGDDYQPADADGYVDHGWFTVTEPAFGDVTGDGIEEAIVVTTENTGGTGQFSGIDVYAIVDGVETVIGSIPGGDRGDGGISDVSVEHGTVVVERMMSMDDDGACCPSKLQREIWTWNGQTFVENEAARTTSDFAW
jgi:hypothetical protein